MNSSRLAHLSWVFAAAWALVACPAPSIAEEGPFVSMDFEKALAEAKKKDKPIFIDFFTTWCNPCKMLDQTTWKDKKVIAWLSEKTIPLKLDAEKETELAQKYKVAGYPTLLFVKADGTEIDRIMGYMPAEDFLSEANGLLQGKDALARAKDKAEANGGKEPIPHLRYGQMLWQKQKNEEALKQFLWCFDEGGKNDAMFAESGRAYVAMVIAELGKTYPAAKDALQERHDAAQKAVEADKATKEQVTGLVALNQALGQPEASQELYAKIKKEHPKSTAVGQLMESLLGEFLEKKDYAEIAGAIDIKAKIDEAFKAYKPPAPDPAAASRPADAPPPPPSMETQRLIFQASNYYQVLIGLKKTKEADELAQRLLKVDGGAQTLNSLAWNGFLTGEPTEANLDQARKANEVSKGKDASIIDTLARLLKARGKKDEAVKLVKDAMEDLTKPFEKQVLGECLKSIEEPGTSDSKDSDESKEPAEPKAKAGDKEKTNEKGESKAKK